MMTWIAHRSELRRSGSCANGSAWQCVALTCVGNKVPEDWKEAFDSIVMAEVWMDLKGSSGSICLVCVPKTHNGSSPYLDDLAETICVDPTPSQAYCELIGAVDNIFVRSLRMLL